MNNLGAIILGAQDPLETHRMMLGGIASHDEDAVRILEIDPVIGHCTASERLCQSRNSSAVSNTCLMIKMDESQPPYGLVHHGTFFVVHDGAAEMEHGFHTVDFLLLVVEPLEILVAGILDVLGQLLKGPVPALLLPLVAVGSAIQGLEQPVVTVDHGQLGRALGTQGAFADGIVRITFGADDLPVLDMGNVVAGYGAEGADRPDLLAAFDLQRGGVRLRRLQIEPQL